MLEIAGLDVYYGESHIVRDASFSLGRGEALAVMGRNGMGKTTLFKAIIGMITSMTGSIRLENVELARMKSYERVARGLAFVPQGRMIFPMLTVEENILAGMTAQRKATVPEYVYRFFPVLEEMRKRRGGNLSGGQQQMLAISRALVSEPRVLILDEPTEGIQPSIIKEIANTLNLLRRERNFSILVSEQVLSFAHEVADRFLVVDRGRIVQNERKENLDVAKIRSYLTI